jgi:para-nitrobenzyl esterase
MAESNDRLSGRFGRRAFFSGTGAFASGILARAQSPDAVVAKTRYGQVRGARKDGVVLFKGIPYAGSPAGVNRFQPAPKLKPWKGVRDALLYGPQSMQPADPMWPKSWKPAVSSEDCLFLNVWTQGADKKKRPVMFYSHGGGFVTGNGGAEVPPQNEFHDGAALARDYDVVVVTHNHRLGVMGYLYLGELLGDEYAASGMAGMLDIADALRWVHENIENFGGDPDRVMIWGESGGGAKTSVLTAMPSAEGIFQRASIESGPALRMRTRDSAEESAEALLAALDLGRKQARELLSMPAAKLIEAGQRLPRRHIPEFLSVTDGVSTGVGFSPMVDGHYLPANPYDPAAPSMSANVPLIVGTNKDETLFLFHTPDVLSMDEASLKRRIDMMFPKRSARLLEVYRHSRPQASPAELFIAITTARWMGMDAIHLAERKAKLEAAPVFMYVFAYGWREPVPPGVPYHSACGHAGEMPFKFDHVPGDIRTNPRARTARNMSRAWASFAKNGDPSHDEIPKWPAYTLGRRATMFLDAECQVVDDPHREERLVWEEPA